MDSPVLVRTPETVDEVTDVVDRWVQDFRKSPWAGVVPNNKYTEVYTEAVRQLLARGARVMLLCNAEHPTQVLGWLCEERTHTGDRVLHYLYLKTLYRGRGLAGLLLRACGFSPEHKTLVTFKTPQTARKLRNFLYRPDIARRMKA